MRARGYGRIVNLSSTMASLELTESPSSPAYRVSKAGLNMLTKVLAAEVEDDGILVNAASPGLHAHGHEPRRGAPGRAGGGHPGVAGDPPRRRADGWLLLRPAAARLVDSQLLTILSLQSYYHPRSNREGTLHERHPVPAEVRLVRLLRHVDQLADDARSPRSWSATRSPPSSGTGSWRSSAATATTRCAVSTTPTSRCCRTPSTGSAASGGSRSDPNAGKRFADGVRSWGPHPDVPEPLKKMGEHYKLVILSNADDSFLEESVPRLGADFHAVFTAEQAGYYKPRYGAFEYMLEQLDAEPEDFVHVSSHTRYDPMPMHDMGFRNLVLLDRGYDPVPPGLRPHGRQVPRRAQHDARHLTEPAPRTMRLGCRTACDGVLEAKPGRDIPLPSRASGTSVRRGSGLSGQRVLQVPGPHQADPVVRRRRRIGTRQRCRRPAWAPPFVYDVNSWVSRGRASADRRRDSEPPTGTARGTHARRTARRPEFPAPLSRRWWGADPSNIIEGVLPPGSAQRGGAGGDLRRQSRTGPRGHAAAASRRDCCAVSRTAASSSRS